MRSGKPTLTGGVLAAGLVLAGMASAGLAAGPPGNGAGCLVTRDLPFYQVRPDSVAPTDTDRHIPARPPMQDPRGLRLLR